MSANSEIIASFHAELVVDYNQLLLHDCEFDFREADLDLLYKESAPGLHLGVIPGVLAIFVSSRFSRRSGMDWSHSMLWYVMGRQLTSPHA